MFLNMVTIRLARNIETRLITVLHVKCRRSKEFQNLYYLVAITVPLMYYQYPNLLMSVN